MTKPKKQHGLKGYEGQPLQKIRETPFYNAMKKLEPVIQYTLWDLIRPTLLHSERGLFMGLTDLRRLADRPWGEDDHPMDQRTLKRLLSEKKIPMVTVIKKNLEIQTSDPRGRSFIYVRVSGAKLLADQVADLTMFWKEMETLPSMIRSNRKLSGGFLTISHVRKSIGLSLSLATMRNHAKRAGFRLYGSPSIWGLKESQLSTAKEYFQKLSARTKA